MQRRRHAPDDVVADEDRHHEHHEAVDRADRRGRRPLRRTPSQPSAEAPPELPPARATVRNEPTAIAGCMARLLRRVAGRGSGWTIWPSLATSVPFDDLVVPVDLERLVLLVEEQLEEGVEVLGVEARRVDRHRRREVDGADDLDAVHLDRLAGHGRFAVAAALGREIDDHRIPASCSRPWRA